MRFILDAILKGLPITPDPTAPMRAFDELLQLARRENISSYDATYLDVAMRNGCPIATLDEGLKTACRHTGVQLWSA